MDFIPPGGGGGPVEGLSAPAGLGIIPLADLHELFAGGAEFLDGVDAVIGAEQGVVMGDVQAVGSVVAEMTFTERPDVVPVPVQNDDRLLATGENEDVVLGVDGYARTLFEGHAAGQFGPVLNKVISEIALTVDIWHRVHLLLFIDF